LTCQTDREMISHQAHDPLPALDLLFFLASPHSRSRPAPGLDLELLLARYFMYAQVYFHPVRVAYDHHLKSFLRAWLPSGKFSTDIKEHLATTDNEISTAIRVSAENSSAAGHNDAARIATRNHFKRLIDFTPDQLNRSPLLPERLHWSKNSVQKVSFFTTTRKRKSLSNSR
jgi:HD associated region